ITQVVAVALFPETLDQVHQSIFQRCLNRASQHFVFGRADGPSVIVPELAWYRIFEVKAAISDLEEIATGNLRFSVWRQSHDFSGFHRFSKDLLSHCR